MKTIGELEIGDVFDVAGAELHEDLSGLVCQVRVSGILTEGPKIGIEDGYSGSTLWFDSKESSDVRIRFRNWRS